MTTTIEQTRETKFTSLKEDFATNYAGREYGEVFEPHGTMTECNFGGLLVILSNTGEGVLVWRDWSDTAIDEKLTEYIAHDLDWKKDKVEPLIEAHKTIQNVGSFIKWAAGIIIGAGVIIKRLIVQK
jgi:hypothetical protein